MILQPSLELVQYHYQNFKWKNENLRQEAGYELFIVYFDIKPGPCRPWKSFSRLDEARLLHTHPYASVNSPGIV